MSLDDEAGYTLLELVVGMAVGLMLLLAAFAAVDSFARTQQTVMTRDQATQDARLKLDGLVRELRSQVCVGPAAPSMLAGTPNSVTFVVDLGDGSVPPEKRVVTYAAAARTIGEQRYAGSLGTGSLTFASTPSSYGFTLAGVDPDGSTPIFGYYAYDSSVPPRPTQALPTPLSDADLARVARITVAFRVGPAAGQLNRKAGTVLQDEVLLRSVDPADPVPLPLCS